MLHDSPPLLFVRSTHQNLYIYGSALCTVIITSSMFPSRMRYSSPSHSPSGTPMASLPEKRLHGLGLSNCHFLPGATEDWLTTSPYMSWLDSPCSHKNQIGHDHRYLSNQHNFLPLDPPATSLASTYPISRSSVPVQETWTVAAALPTSVSSLQYHFPTALASFSHCQYQTASPLYETTISSITDASYSWCDLETQGGYQPPKLSSSYSTPLRLVSPTLSHAVFAASAPESPTFAANLQRESEVDDYIDGDLAADFIQSQHRTQTSRASSWLGGCSNLEQFQDMDAIVSIQRSQRDLANSKKSYRSSHKASRGGNGGSHRTRGVRARVPCSYGDKCGQTFNRKTDLERHINTVRHTQKASHLSLIRSRFT